MIVETIFLEAWRAQVELEYAGDQIHWKAQNGFPEELKRKILEHKQELLRFLAPHGWLMTPQGWAKFVMSLNDGKRCGVVLKSRPDRVTWVERSELWVI